MIRLASAPLVLVLFAAVPGEDDPAPVDPGRREAIEFALGAELALVRTAPPAGEALSGVASATDTEGARLGRVELYAGRGEFGGSEQAVRLAWVPIVGSPGDAAAVIALTDEGRFLAAAVLDADGDPVNEWDGFTSNLRFAVMPSPEGARPRAWLAARRAEVALDAETEDQRLVAALLDLQRHMNEQASVMNIRRGAHPLSPAEQLAMMRDRFGAVARLAPALEPILGDRRAEFVRLAEEASAAAAEAIEPVEAGDLSRYREARSRVVKSCKACHGLTGHRLEGPLFEASAEKREALGIGDGFFEVGHDLRISHPDRDRIQRVADAFRIGVLMVEAARPAEERDHGRR